MEMPEGLRELIEDLDVCTTPNSYAKRVDEAIEFLKEMAEALEKVSSRSMLEIKKADPMGIEAVLKKFRDWK